MAITLIATSIIGRSLGADAALCEAISIVSILLAFLTPSKKSLLTIFFFAALYLAYYIFAGVEYVIYLSWGIAIISISMSKNVNIDSSALKYLTLIYVILFFYAYYKLLINPIDLSLRDGLIFDGPLALGLFCSSAVFFIYCAFDDLKVRSILYCLLIPVILVSGARHPSLILIFILLFELFSYFETKNHVKNILFLACIIMIICVLFLLIDLDELGLRSISSVDNSDVGRLKSWSELMVLDTPYKFLLGAGRENVGSIGVRVKGSAYVIESSYGTIVLSYGVLGSIILIGSLAIFFRQILLRLNSKIALSACLLMMLEPFLSQRFETPAIMWFYFVGFLMLPNLDRRLTFKLVKKLPKETV